ncbi:MAG: hypothetical protein JSR44_14020 [Spirochaetes bacterium]|nr:hypothetical protein [Spirochaetota bacterium]
MAEKKYAEKGIVEFSGTGSAAINFDGRGGTIALSPSANYFFVPHWYFGTSFTFEYSTFNPNLNNSTNAPIQWAWYTLPMIEVGYARAFAEHWYWFAAAGFSYLAADCYYCTIHGFSSRSWDVKLGLKHNIGNALLMIGIFAGGITQSAELFFRVSVFF